MLRASAIAALALTFASACSSSSHNDTVITRADPAVNFTAYRTFAVQTQTPPGVTIPADVSANLAVVINDSRTELVKQGLVEVDPSTTTPDVWLFSLTSTQETGGYVWSCVPGQWWGYWGWVWDPCAWLEPVYVTYSLGTVVIGLSDANLQKVVFGGVIQGALTGTLDQGRLANDVARVFDAYPATQTGTGATDAGTTDAGTTDAGVRY